MIRAAAASLSALAFATPAAAGHAPVAFEASVTPDQVTFPGENTLTYRLDMKSGQTESGRDIAFSAFARLPLYGAAFNPGAGEGSPLHIEAITLEGAASSPSHSWLSVEPACSPRTDQATGPNAAYTFHGFSPEMARYDIRLPPNAHGAMVVRASTGPFAPWRSLDYLIRFEIGPTSPWPPEVFAPETVAEQTVIAPEPPKQRGKAAVEMVLRTDPPSKIGAVPRVKAGKRIHIRGLTSPPIPGQFVTLRYFRPDDGREAKLRRLARVRIGRSGRFSYGRWRPKMPGRYELWAFYKSQRPQLLSDHACPLFYDVTR